MTIFAQLDRLAAAPCFALFGVSAVVEAMRPSAAGPNARREPDPDRGATTIRAIRAEYSARADVSDNGLGRNPGMMRLNIAGQRNLVTFAPGGDWPPRQGDEMHFLDRPGQRYRLGEPLPESEGLLTFVFHKI